MQDPVCVEWDYLPWQSVVYGSARGENVKGEQTPFNVTCDIWKKEIACSGIEI